MVQPVGEAKKEKEVERVFYNHKLDRLEVIKFHNKSFFSEFQGHMVEISLGDLVGSYHYMGEL